MFGLGLEVIWFVLCLECVVLEHIAGVCLSDTVYLQCLF